LLGQEGITQVGGPLNVVCQAFHNVRQRSHGLNARIPRLFLNCFGQSFLVAGEVLVPIQPLLELNNLQRIS
jgi:hypothetical protein